ncbi:hypothetical protein Vau01_123030 [Virgisporangium aurantiacum]|uniref:PD-(D/E)XK nuclease superfamily protein n=1 Tax=Virgisporangium aurantiacum TaxID=175570 RepID=A0A8J3ZIL5_9ACTN|nr:hypothetical protein Vau01_123030 [Virgisporangium aurantiacum]
MTDGGTVAIVAAVSLPALQFALPLGSEIRWSDMLATLIATDPLPLCELLDLSVRRPEDLRVRREVTIGAKHQPDLILELDGRRLALIEVKVLAGLGPAQLNGYLAAVPDADRYVVVYPERLVIDVAAQPPWCGLTWEYLLKAHTTSANAWVSTTATAWLAHLDASLPKVGADTVWNALTPGEDFVVAMRARMSWLHGQLNPPVPIDHDLVPSTAGVSWVVRLFADAAVPGYQILVEVEENLPVRDFPKLALPGGQQPLGPSIKVCLRQDGVQTSAGFDWDYLLAVWPTMRDARSDWVRNRAQPKAAHDRQAYKTMVAKGGPPFLGIGFGEAQAKQSKACMFGARLQLQPTVRLADIKATLESLYELIEQMAAVHIETTA